MSQYLMYRILSHIHHKNWRQHLLPCGSSRFSLRAHTEFVYFIVLALSNYKLCSTVCLFVYKSEHSYERTRPRRTTQEGRLSFEFQSVVHFRAKRHRKLNSSPPSHLQIRRSVYWTSSVLANNYSSTDAEYFKFSEINNRRVSYDDSFTSAFRSHITYGGSGGEMYIDLLLNHHGRHPYRHESKMAQA